MNIKHSFYCGVNVYQNYNGHSNDTKTFAKQREREREREIENINLPEC